MELESLIEESSDAGTWFRFRGKAEFKVRRISGPERRAAYRRTVGRKIEKTVELEKSADYQIALAGIALVDSKGLQVPARYLSETELAGQEGNVCLDGKWTDKVKKALLTEVEGLAVWIVKKADTLTAAAEEEEEGKG